MNDLALFLEYVSGIENSKATYARWKKANPDEATKWALYRDAVLAQSSAVPPALASNFGKALVAAARMGEDEVAIFRNEFLPNAQAATISFPDWKKRYYAEFSAWMTYRDAIIRGELPKPPEPTSKFGKALVSAGHLAERTDMKVSLSTSQGVQNLEDTVTVTASVTPAGQVTKVEFFVDDVLRSTDTSSPFNFSWDTTAVNDGAHQLKARASYPRSKVAEAMLNVTVENVATPPPPPPPQGPPVNTVLPTISGLAKEGQTLVVLTGSWTNSPTSFTRQWMRCDAAGANGAAIPAATNPTYVLTSADVGKTIRCVVVAYNTVGGASAAVQSAQTAVVAALAPAVPVNTGLPQLAGSAIRGSQLAVSNGAWTNAPTSYTYQWRSCDTSGANCANISGATTSSYVLAATDVGKTVRCNVVAANAAGAGTAAPSVATGTIVDPAPPPPPSEWTKVADENQSFVLTATKEVRYGLGTAWTSKVLAAGTYGCNNDFFGDPLSGTLKVCEARPTAVPPPSPAVGVPVGAWRIATGAADSMGDADRWSYVGMNAWDYTRIAALKADNANLKCIVYKCMSSTRSGSGNTLAPAGVGYPFASTTHPEWFSTLNGARMEWPPYPGSWQMNVGMAAYQNQWAQNVIAECQANGWDGIMADNANVTPYGALPSQYPSNAAFQAATRSFLANVGPQIRAAGLLLLPNIQPHGDIGSYGPALWQDWIQFTSGALREFWIKWGEGNGSHFYDPLYWTTQLGFMNAAQAGGKTFIALTYAPIADTRSMRYGYASFLIEWNGGPSCFMFEGIPESGDPWSAEWTRNMGTPVGAKVASGVGWKRTYTGGVVYVNPSQTSNVTIDGQTLTPMTGLLV